MKRSSRPSPRSLPVLTHLLGEQLTSRFIVEKIQKYVEGDRERIEMEHHAAPIGVEIGSQLASGITLIGEH